MSADANKRAIDLFALHYSKGDWEALASLLTDDFRWVVPAVGIAQSPLMQTQPAIPGPIEHGRDTAISIFGYIQQGCVDGLTITIRDVILDGDKAAVEAESLGVNAANGRTYRNLYAYVMHFRDGRICLLREYQDTLHMFDVWLA